MIFPKNLKHYLTMLVPKIGDKLRCGACLGEMGFVDQKYIDFALSFPESRRKELFLEEGVWLSYDKCEDMEVLYS